jgi:uncharacterized protein (DUF2235 family)
LAATVFGLHSIGADMAKNIVVCCDGTGNQVEANLSNVLKLFRIVSKTDLQRVYYTPGIGTLGSNDGWTRIKQDTKAVFELATGYGLDHDIMSSYQFVSQAFEEGDSIFLFGFSRGAYTVRALAGLIHMVGLLPPDQLNIANYALTAYKRSSEENDFDIAWNFSRVAGARRELIKFMGVWDTVASILVPRRDRLVPSLQTLPYTRTNPSVEIFRHAIAIDERRRMFRLNRWTEPQSFVANPFDTTALNSPQDVKQVWFAGVHGDIGGGYPEAQSAISKFPLAWMIDEAVAHGLKINVAMKNNLVLGRRRADGSSKYIGPNSFTRPHDSLTPAWKPLEWLPKSMKWNEWSRSSLFGYYIPRAEPRVIANPDVPPRIHASVLELKTAIQDYNPSNLPTDFVTEPWPYS